MLSMFQSFFFLIDEFYFWQISSLPLSKRFKICFEGGEASIWDYGQKLKKHLLHFFAKFQLSTVYRFWDISFQSWEISPTVFPVEIQVSRNWDILFKF